MNDDLQWNREGKTGVLGSGMELVEMVFFF